MLYVEGDERSLHIMQYNRTFSAVKRGHVDVMETRLSGHDIYQFPLNSLVNLNLFYL